MEVTKVFCEAGEQVNSLCCIWIYLLGLLEICRLKEQINNNIGVADTLM